MSFNARTFIFDGVPCEEYGLMLYNFDNPSTRESNVGTNVNIAETRLNRGTKPIFYGTAMNEPMQFSMTFGSLEPMTKYEVDLVAGWLTGHSEYKWLEIIQDDLVDVRYKCFINNLKEVSINGSPIAFTCDVICDSQFAYEYPQTYTYKIDGETTIDFFNRSSHNGYLYPKITISEMQNGNLDIINITDNRRKFTIKNMPLSLANTIDIDCERQIIAVDNIYENDNPLEDLKYSSSVTIPKGRIRGDVNGDGKITEEDAQEVLARMSEDSIIKKDPIAARAADANVDRNINVSDMNFIRHRLMKTGKYARLAEDGKKMVELYDEWDIEVLGNWQTNPNWETERVQFYADIEFKPPTGAPPLNETCNIIISVSSSQYITAEIIGENLIRFWSVIPPVEDVKANIEYDTSDSGVLIMKNSGYKQANIYPYTNYKFPRLVKGQNKLKVTGNCTLTLQCEFLRKVGS